MERLSIYFTMLKKLYFTIFVLFGFAGIYSLDAKTVLLNISQSSFSYLADYVCTYDTTTNNVSCIKGNDIRTQLIFQNIKKVGALEKVESEQLLGSFVDTDEKKYDLYALSPQQALNHTQDLLDTIKATAKVLFNPVDSTTTGSPKPNPYALTSINAAAVDALFGPGGLNVEDKTIIQYFKNFYFYLEYVVRLEYAARLAALSSQENVDMLTIIENKSWQEFVSTMESKAGGWKNLEKKLMQNSLVPDWDALAGLIQATSWHELVTTSFWTSLNNITNESIVNSGFWQKYVKYIITRSFIQDQSLLLSIKEVEETIFKYIPNIEIAYYNPDFTSLRNASEMFHISLILTDALRARFLPYANDWQNFKETTNYDLVKTYSLVLDFQKTPFYSIAALAEENQNQIYTSAAQNKVPIDIKTFKQEPLLQEELLVLSMIKILHALTNYLYDIDHLENSMNVLANKNIKKPLPSIFIYAPEDYLYLEDLNLLHNNFKEMTAKPKTLAAAQRKDNAKTMLTNVLQNRLKPVSKSVKVQGFLDDLWGDVKNAGEKVWKDLKNVGNDAVDFAEDAGKAIADEAKAIGFGTAAVFLSGIDPTAAKRLLDDAKKLQSEVAKDIDKAKTALEHTVTDVEDAAKDTISGLAKVMNDVCDVATGKFDPEICKAIAGSFESAFDFVIDEISGDLQTYIALAGGMMRLTADGIALIANSATDVISGNWSGLGDDLKSGLLTMCEDAATAILEPLTIQFKYFIATLADAFKFCQYFISIITRLFIDATTAITYAIGATIAGFASVFGVNIDPGQWASAVDTALSEHERLIGTCVTTALLLATIPLTGGASIPLIVMTLGPQIFAAYGSYQADELAIQQKHDEKEFVHNFGIFVDNNKTVYQQQQDEWSTELNAKYTSELENQERGLGFYENFLANNFESLKEQMSSVLGSYWSQIVTHDSFGMVPADIGSLYGFKTGIYELNPSQGFSLYSAARDSYSQEIAVFPAITLQQDGSLTTVAETKNWFNQKEVAILDNPVNEVEIKFKGIYLLNSFHIGLYFGGEDINLNDIKKNQKAPLDLGHLAKMAVFKKEDKDHPVTFGVYEHEGKGWLSQSLESPPFMLGEWYHIKMVLSGTNLSVKVWNEANQEPSGASSFQVSVSPSQKIIGVISSGASIEYQFVTPKIPAIPMNGQNSAFDATKRPKLRPEDQRCGLPCDFKNPSWVDLLTEKYRESIARPSLDYVMSPTVSNIPLNAVGKMQVLRGQYIYTTKATNLVVGGKAVDDYVVLCNMVELIDTYSIVPTTIGENITLLNLQVPQASVNMISLISENGYGTDGTNLYMHLTKVFDNYVAQYGPLTDALEKEIKTLRQNYFKQAMAFTFGLFKLEAVSQDLLEQGNFIYTTTLKDPNKGDVVKDEKGNPLNDYFLLTVLDSEQPPSYSTQRGNPGISYNDLLSNKSKKYGILSLVSGNLYGETSEKPINSGFRTTILLRNYERNQGSLPANLHNAIVNAQQFYTKIEAEGNTSTPDTGKSSQSTSSTDMGTKKDNKGTSSGPNVPPQKPADQSAQQRADEASGCETVFGGPSS